MSSDVFWNLTLYDWGLWMSKIEYDLKREHEYQELEWQRLSYLQALMVNITPFRDKNAKASKPTDFFTPSWQKTVSTEVGEDTRTPEQKEQLSKVLGQFKKKIKPDG